MAKDKRYKVVKTMLDKDIIIEFRQILEVLPKTVIARELRTNNNRMTRLLSNVREFSLDELYRISRALTIDFRKLVFITCTQILNDENGKRQNGAKRSINNTGSKVNGRMSPIKKKLSKARF